MKHNSSAGTYYNLELLTTLPEKVVRYLNSWIGNFCYFCENFQDYELLVVHE